MKVTSPNHERIPYALELVLKPPDISVSAKNPLTQVRWFKLPWEGVMYGNPFDIVTRIVEILDACIVEIELTPVEKMQVADFRHQLGCMAQMTHLLHHAEQLYSASARSFEMLGDKLSAIAVLGDLETMYVQTRNHVKAEQVRIRIRYLQS